MSSKLKNKKIHAGQKKVKNWPVVLLFFLVGFALYINTFQNQLIWDDVVQIVNNVFVHNFDIKSIFTTNTSAGAQTLGNHYRPLMILSFAVDYSFWELNPAGYHLTNILLHILTSVLIYFLFLSLKARRSVSFLTGFIFLIHPIGSESVAYIGSRGELLSALFVIITVLAFVKFKDPAVTENKKIIFYTLSFVSFLFSLLSKETNIVIPPLLVILHFTFMDRGFSKENIKRIFLNILPFVISTILYIVLRLTLLKFTDEYTELNFNIIPSVIQFLKVLFIYGGFILFPTDLHYRLERTVETAGSYPEIILVSLILAAIVYFSFRSFKKQRIVFFGFSWFFINLIMLSGILVTINYALGIRWLRLPVIGLFFMAAVLIMEILQKLKERSRMAEKIFISGLIVYFIILSVITFRANMLYKDAITIFTSLVKYYPQDPSVHHNLGHAYHQADMNIEAVKEYGKAIELNPHATWSLYNQGRIYESLGQFNEAAENYRKVIELDKEFSEAYVYLSYIYSGQGRYEEARDVLEKLKISYYDFPEPYQLLGDVYLQLNNIPMAIENYEISLRLDPENTRVKETLEGLRNK